MALPNSINPASPAGTENPALGDDQLRGIKQYLVDVVGFPDNQNVTAAMGTLTTSGLFTFSQSPLTVPTLLRGTASQILRIESQYSQIAFGINGATVLGLNATGMVFNTRYAEWVSGVTGVIGTAGSQPLVLRTNTLDRWQINPSGMLAPVVSVIDIGTPSGPNPRNAYIASNLVVGGNIQWGTNPEILPSITGTRGDIFYRGQSHWLNLAAGTSGQYLRTRGSSNDPLWVTDDPGTGVSTDSNPVTWTGQHTWNAGYNFAFSHASALLGVGTSTPTQMLHIAGRGYIASHLDTGGQLRTGQGNFAITVPTGLLDHTQLTRGQSGMLLAMSGSGGTPTWMLFNTIANLPDSTYPLGNLSASGEFIQRGTFNPPALGSVDTAIYVSSDQTVSFAVAFSSTPFVMWAGTTDAANNHWGAIDSITTTSFRFSDIGDTSAENLANGRFVALGS